jgi:hypothetical protein
MFWRRKVTERDIEREIRGHLELEAEEQRERGLAPPGSRQRGPARFRQPNPGGGGHPRSVEIPEEPRGRSTGKTRGSKRG